MKYQQFKQSIKNYIIIGAYLLGSCSNQSNQRLYESAWKGYDVLLSNREIRIGNICNNGYRDYFANDVIYARDIDGDNKYDELKAKIEAGSPLEYIASLAKLDSLASSLQ